MGRSIAWTRFAVWLSLLLYTHGNNVLRVKGLLLLDNSPGPVLVNCVRHIVYFPEHLQRWPDERRASKLVFIVRGIDPIRIRRSLDLFTQAHLTQSPGSAYL